MLYRFQQIDSLTGGCGLLAVVVRCAPGVYLSLQFALGTDNTSRASKRTCPEVSAKPLGTS